MQEEKRYAVLIDADNIAPKYIGSILNEISNKGIITYKRIYADWTSSNASSWKKVLLQHAVTPVQQYSYTHGKNSTDSAMIIDAMDILYSGHVDGFALCSSDSDFTRLAVRLRESGMTVVGLGESKTPKPFCDSCNEFKFLDVISDVEDKSEGNDSPDATSAKESAVTSLATIAESIKDIIIENGDDNNAMNMGELGSRLQKRHPDFDTRNYGYAKFSTFVRQFKNLKIEHKGSSQTVILQFADSGPSLEKDLIEIVRSHGKKGIYLGTLSSDLRKKYPEFSQKDYGYSKFEQFVRSFDTITIKENNPFRKMAVLAELLGEEQKDVPEATKKEPSRRRTPAKKKEKENDQTS